MRNLDNIIKETIDWYLDENLLSEDIFDEKKKHERENPLVKLSMDNIHKAKDEKHKKGYSKKALKAKGGLRKDRDIDDDEKYNKNVDDQEQFSVQDILTNGFVNIKKVAQLLYPDHTPEGAQSQLNKKLRGDKSDSGSTYRLKAKELKKLRHIIATHLNG